MTTKKTQMDPKSLQAWKDNGYVGRLVNSRNLLDDLSKDIRLTTELSDHAAVLSNDLTRFITAFRDEVFRNPKPMFED